MFMQTVVQLVYCNNMWQHRTAGLQVVEVLGVRRCRIGIRVLEQYSTKGRAVAHKRSSMPDVSKGKRQALRLKEDRRAVACSFSPAAQYLSHLLPSTGHRPAQYRCAPAKDYPV